MLSANEINLLQAQNEGLKKSNAELQRENADLKAENVRLEEDLSIACINCANLIAKDDEIMRYKTALQEIKKILLQAMDVKSNAYNHFLKVEQAIDLITKEEEE